MLALHRRLLALRHDSQDRNGERVDGGLDLAGDEGVVVRLDRPTPGN